MQTCTASVKLIAVPPKAVFLYQYSAFSMKIPSPHKELPGYTEAAAR